jgi:hypothetical protein
MAKIKNTIKPATEQKLTELQKKYLKNRKGKDYQDSIYFQDMFKEMIPYARSLILKTTRGKIYLPPDLVDDAALDSAIKLMSQYEKPDFSIGSSFAGYLKFKVLESLYNSKIIKEDAVTSLNLLVENKGTTSTEFEDLQESLNFTHIFHPDSHKATEDPSEYVLDKKEDAIDSVLTVVTDLFLSLDLRVAMRVIIGILSFIRKHENYPEYREYYLTEEEVKILDLALLELRNRLANMA